MTGRKPVLRGIACLALAAAAAHAGECKFTAVRSGSAPLTGIQSIEIDAGPGDLHVTGVAGVQAVEAHGRACASRQDLIDQLVIAIERHGNVLKITGATPHSGFLAMFGRSPVATLDLTVSVPANLPIRLTDGSGDLEVGRVDALDLVDDSGDIRVHDVAHDLSIDDGSGDLAVRDIGGNVTVRDTSGDISAVNVGGNLLVLADTSGDVNADGIGGDLQVRAGSASRVHFGHVRGSVELPARVE
jgi:hypothetical protein